MARIGWRLASLASGVFIAGMGCGRHSASELPPPLLTFDGPTTGLKHTVVVPTLDTPIPPGKNVVWCASFALAWEKLRDDVVKQPIAVQGAMDVADRLNRIQGTEQDLPPTSYYAKAGMPIVQAEQMIDFNLNCSGAELKSE